MFHKEQIQDSDYLKLPAPMDNESAEDYDRRLRAQYFERCAPDKVSLQRAWLADIASESTRDHFIRDAEKYWFQRKLEGIAKAYDKAAAKGKPRQVTKFCGTLADRMGFTRSEFLNLMKEFDFYDPGNSRVFPLLGRGALGSGMTRTTFPIGDNLILKVCSIGGECRDNENEVRVFAQDAKLAYAKRPVTTRVYEYGDDYIIEERVSASEAPPPRKCGFGNGYTKDVVEDWMSGLVGENVRSLSGRTEVLRDIEGNRFNHMLDTYYVQDLHSDNWGINKQCDPVIIDAGWFDNEPKISAKTRDIEPETFSCERVNPLPEELFDFDIGGSLDQKLGTFWDLARRGKVPGVLGAVAPDMRIFG